MITIPGRASLLVAGILIGAGVLGSTSSASAAGARDTLRIAQTNDIRGTDPGMKRDALTDAVLAHIVEGLVAYREDTSIGLMLARSLDVSPDGKTYTFTLRPGLKFHNGQPVLAKYFVANWARYMDPVNNWRCLQQFRSDGPSPVAAIAAPDDATVVYTLARPSSLFLANLARPDCGSAGVYHPESLKADGTWDRPIGTGPYRLGEWRHDEYVELDRFDGYAALPGERDGMTGHKEALIPKVRFVVVPDESTEKAALFTGDIDIVASVPDSDLPDYRANSDVIVQSTPSFETQLFLFRTEDPALQDRRIREAFLLALDLPEITAAMSNGQSRASYSIIPSASRYYKDAQAALPKRDVERARALLQEAGYDGKPLTIIANKQYGEMFTGAVVAQQMVKDAGINVDIEVLDWSTQLDRYNKGAYQIASTGFSARLDPSLSFEQMAGNKETQPRKVWDNPDALKLLDESMSTSDPAERQAILDRMEALYRADIPAIGLYSVVKSSAARTEVSGYKDWALGEVRAWGVSLED
ncbi:MAG TPA: ABC transporter substrate-binding protein [Inquilinus sp.]